MSLRLTATILSFLCAGTLVVDSHARQLDAICTVSGKSLIVLFPASEIAQLENGNEFYYAALPDTATAMCDIDDIDDGPTGFAMIGTITSSNRGACIKRAHVKSIDKTKYIQCHLDISGLFHEDDNGRVGGVESYDENMSVDAFPAQKPIIIECRFTGWVGEDGTPELFVTKALFWKEGSSPGPMD